MLFNELITLMNVTYTENALGDYIESSVNRTVFVNKKSVSQSEFYQAAATGLKPEVKFEVRTIEYQGEQKFLYNGKVYTIIRTFEKEDELTELIGSGVVGESNV